jgi:hypothetical protein
MENGTDEKIKKAFTVLGQAMQEFNAHKATATAKEQEPASTPSIDNDPLPWETEQSA